MTESNPDSGNYIQAQAQVEQLWKAPPSIADIQKPIELDSSNGFDQNFIPYEIEYGVVMDQLSKIYKSWKSTIREYIANAESACISVLKNKESLGTKDYEPLIQITYNPEQCMLQIEDNGIGLSKRMFLEVFRYFGRSRNAFDPTISGMFGLGAKSFVMLVGDKGSMLLHTKSRETGECYKMYARKAGFDVLPFEDRIYGTSFTFIHDPTLNRAHVIEAIKKYSQYVRVPVYFTMVGSPVVVTEECRAPVAIQPHGPELISMNSLESTTEAEVQRQTTESSHWRGRHSISTELSYETEHYDFSGCICQYSDSHNVRGLSSHNVLMLLISMPTEEIHLELFYQAIVRIKSETGPAWLPKPTPDRERFEEKSLARFLKKLRSDLIQKLLEKNIVGKVESYSDFFKLTKPQEVIWQEIHEKGELCSYIPEKMLPILTTLFSGIDSWRPGEGGRSRRRLSSDSRFSYLYQALEHAIRNETFIYLAPSSAKKSGPMRERAKTAISRNSMVLLDFTPPDDLKSQIDVFRDLSEIKLATRERILDEVVIHQVTVAKSEWEKTRDSTTTTSLDSLADYTRKQAVALGHDDAMSKYTDLLRLPSHSCPVVLFKATQAQIKWLHANTSILTIQEYISWAKRQMLQTSMGPMTVEEINGRKDAILHSIIKPIGMRLMHLFKDGNTLYVPISGEDYFMLAATRNGDDNRAQMISWNHILDKFEIQAPDKLEPKYYHTDGQEEREAIWAYAKLTIPNSKDLHAIDTIIKDTPIDELIHIVDCIARLRNHTESQKNNEAQPELLVYLFGEVKT